MDNYALARDRAQSYFLNYDQTKIIARWNLRFDEANLYLDFLGRPYAVCRKSGRIVRCFDGCQAGFSEVLSIFDLLCHSEEKKVLSGHLAPVNSLRGCAPSAGVGTDFHGKTAQYLDQNFSAFCDACWAIGGITVDMGDVGFAFPVFGEMGVILKFYRSDEEFPASVTLLWDENTLDFVFYETVFYMAGFLLETICAQMKSLEIGR